MSDTAAVRALRTMDLIPYILEHPGISINQLSKNFAVTEKEIEKDLQLAFMCGLPGYTPYELIDLTYEDGVVSIIDPQVLNKPRSFSSNERVVIALGLEILKNINSSNDDNLKKIENLSKKFMDEESGDSVMIVEQNLTFPFLNIINQAVFETRVIVFDYQSISKDVLSNRKVTPYKLFLQNGNLYLSGYDYHAQSDRIFKADQIVNCAIGGQANLGQASSPQKEETVELIVDLKAVNFIERNSTIIIDQKMRNGQLHVKLKVSNFDWLKRAILSNCSPRIQEKPTRSRPFSGTCARTPGKRPASSSPTPPPPPASFSTRPSCSTRNSLRSRNVQTSAQWLWCCSPPARTPARCPQSREIWRPAPPRSPPPARDPSMKRRSARSPRLSGWMPARRAASPSRWSGTSRISS